MNTELKIVDLVKSDGMTRIYKMSDGTIQTWRDGTASWRHNNPGNMKFEYAGSADKTVKTTRTKEKALSDAKARYEGVVALDQRGNAIFESISKGNQARFKLLKTSHGNKTIRTMLDEYAIDDYTGQTNNDAYAKSIYAVGEKRGLDIKNILIKDMNEAQFTALVDGMKKHEGFKAGTIIYENVTSILVNTIDFLKNPYVGAKITISYQPEKGSKVTKSFTADEHGKIPSFDAPAGSVLSFTINGKSIEKTITLEAGKTKPLTLIDATPQPIKAKTAQHDGAPKLKEDPKTESKTLAHHETSSKTVRFDISLIDADTNTPLPKTSYYLEYKGKQKAHQTDDAGTEAIDANAGETITVYVDGYNSHHQKVSDFTVKEGMEKINIKIPSHTFDIMLRNQESPLAKYPFETHYRGRVKGRITNTLGKVTVTALIGQEVLLKTNDGEKIISFFVDTTKQVYSCLLSSDSKTKPVAEKPKIAIEKPKVEKPKAQDISPKQSVIDERSAKGNPITNVSTFKNTDKYLFPLNVKSKPKSYAVGTMGAFGAKRSHGKRTHAGCDLYADAGTEVRAMADGVVRIVSYFYENTDQIEIVHNNHIIRYGEVLINKSLVKTGDPVKRGQVIGYVGHLSIEVPSNMLHLEMYSDVNDEGTLSGSGKYKRRTDLIDPTKFLNESEI